MKMLLTALLSMLATLGFGQLNNSDFEVWETTFSVVHYDEIVGLFGIPGATGGRVANWSAGSDFGVCRTTDSYAGDYAVVLHNWYNYANEWVTYHDTLSSRPQYLQGYFKYRTGENQPLSYGIADVALTKYNGAFSDTIATGRFQFDSTDIYTPFQIALDYRSTQQPDSIYVYFRNAYNSCSNNNLVCNLLYLDKLALSGSPLSSLEDVHASTGDFTIYPNPFSHSTTLHTTFNMADASVEVYNVYGQRLRHTAHVDGQTFTLYRDHLPTGQYFIKITQSNGLVRSHKMLIID